MPKKHSIQVPIYMALIILKPSRYLDHTCCDISGRTQCIITPTLVEQGVRVELKESLAWDSVDAIYDSGSLQDISADEFTNGVGRQPCLASSTYL